MTDVRRKGIDFLPVGIESEREVLAILNPEVSVEASLQICRIAFKLVGKDRILPDEASQARAPKLGVVCVTLELTRRPWKTWQCAVMEGNGIPRVFPALIFESGLFVAP